jgi:hypothetical protein
VAELRRLADDFSRAAQKLDDANRTLTHQLGFAPWLGPIADLFRGEWNNASSRQISAVSHALRDAARNVQRNADEQDRASGAVSAGSPWDVIVGAVGAFSTIAGYVDVLTGHGLNKRAEALLALVGIAGSGGDVADLLGEDTGGNRIVGGLNVSSQILGLAGIGLRSLNPLGLALGVAGAYIDATIPLDEGDMAGVRDMGAKHMFGRDVDALTPGQREALDKRYEGPWGVAHKISDQMDSTAEDVKGFFRGIFG